MGCVIENAVRKHPEEDAADRPDGSFDGMADGFGLFRRMDPAPA